MAILYDTRLAGGKSAYEYAVDGGYTGTEQEFAELFNNMGNASGGSEWKLVGSATGGSYVTLPSEFNELYLEVKSITTAFPNDDYRYPFSTLILNKISLSSDEKYYAMPMADCNSGYNDGIILQGCLTKIKLSHYLAFNNPQLEYFKLNVYYR